MKALKIATLLFGACSYILGQDASPSDNSSPANSVSPAASLSPALAPSPTPTTPVRSVRLSFVPPPMEGTISLGIFDENKKLVRVLHREAKIDNFTVGENSLG